MYLLLLFKHELWLGELCFDHDLEKLGQFYLHSISTDSCRAVQVFLI